MEDQIRDKLLKRANAESEATGVLVEQELGSKYSGFAAPISYIKNEGRVFSRLRKLGINEKTLLDHEMAECLRLDKSAGNTDRMYVGGVLLLPSGVWAITQYHGLDLALSVACVLLGSFLIIKGFLRARQEKKRFKEIVSEYRQRTIGSGSTG